MGIEELFEEIRSLPPAQQAQVIDFVARLRNRENDDATQSTLDAIVDDPERLARFRVAIDVGWQQSERSEGRAIDEVVAELRARGRRMQGVDET